MMLSRCLVASALLVAGARRARLAHPPSQGTDKFITKDSCNGAVELIPKARTMLGQVVTIKGVITAVTPGIGGFFVQEVGNGDNDDSTSDGIFVNDTVLDPVETLVMIVGEISSDVGNVQITPSEDLVVCGNESLPAPVKLNELPTRKQVAEGYWNTLYGMLIEVTDPLIIVDMYWLSRAGSLTLASGKRPIAGSQVHPPETSEYFEWVAGFRDTLILDDASNEKNPKPIPFPGTLGFSAGNWLRAGDTMSKVSGPLSIRFGKARVDMKSGMSTPVHKRGSRPDTPNVPGRIRIASVNVENYFNGPQAGMAFGDGRGAGSLGEFEKQRAKILQELSKIDAHIYAFAELENNGGGPHSAIQDIVNGLNGDEPDGINRYQTVSGMTEKISWAITANGFIYKPNSVKVVGSPAILNKEADELFREDKNRPSVAITFQEVGYGNNETFTVVANHFKSKGSSCENLDDVWIPGAGNCNGVRTNASVALGRWLKTNPTGVHTDNILITGDMNSFHSETPIQTLIKTYGYVDVLDRDEKKEHAYSYSYQGVAGYLDHALASPSLAGKIQKATDWHINADESDMLGYKDCTNWRGDEPFRASDHDPLIIGLF